MGNIQLNKMIEETRASLAASKALLAILNERERQRDVHGYDEKHDDAHGWGEIAQGAAAYAKAAAMLCHELSQPAPGGRYCESWGEAMRILADHFNATWPWDASTVDLETDPKIYLVKAGAMIVAELERLERGNPSKPE